MIKVETSGVIIVQVFCVSFFGELTTILDNASVNADCAFLTSVISAASLWHMLEPASNV